MPTDPTPSTRRARRAVRRGPQALAPLACLLLAGALAGPAAAQDAPLAGQPETDRLTGRPAESDFAEQAPATGELESDMQPAADGGDDDVAPAPPSIGADVPLTYFGPSPSLVQKELVGPYQLLKAGTVDLDESSITLPLYRGRMASGETVWYVVTDTNDAAAAAALGLNHSGKLTFADIGDAVRTATVDANLQLVFEAGTVDFTPEHRVVPGEAPNFFPPAEMQPGSVGDAMYSPLVKVTNAGGQIYNAPMIAFDVDEETLNGVLHRRGGPLDRARPGADDLPARGRGEDAPDPGLQLRAPGTLHLDRGHRRAAGRSGDGHPRARAERHPQGRGRQPVLGRGADLRHGQRPDRYRHAGSPGPRQRHLGRARRAQRPGRDPHRGDRLQPAVDMNLGFWTQAAIDEGIRTRVTDEFQILGLVQQGWITGMNGEPYGSIGEIVNCAIVFRFL